VARDAVEEARMFNTGHTINLDVPTANEPLLTSGDPQRLLQAMLNLLQNALKYTPEDKPVEVGLRRERAQGDGASDTALIAIQDNGPGIATQDLESIFTRFYQGSRKGRPAQDGLGLGLFIARGIIEQHGGEITVDSTIGEGSTFTIRLPLQEGE